MTKILSALAVLFAALLTPGTAWADGTTCASDAEFRDIIVRDANDPGWHRDRVIDHFDIAPSSSFNPAGGLDKSDHWNATRSCDGTSSYTVHYQNLHDHFHAVSKCVVDAAENVSRCVSSN